MDVFVGVRRASARHFPAPRRCACARSAPLGASAPSRWNGSVISRADPVARIERAIGVLEDDLHLAPRAQLAALPLPGSVALEDDCAAPGRARAREWRGRGSICPQPDSPTRPTFSPRVDDEARPRRRRGKAPARREQALARQRVVAHHVAAHRAPARRRRFIRRAAAPAGELRRPRTGHGIGVAHGAKTSPVSPLSTTSPSRMMAMRWAMPGDDGEIVGDEHQAHPVFLDQPLQQVEDLRLRRHVERRRRLVGDQQRGRSAMAMAMTTRWRWPPDSSCG